MSDSYQSRSAECYLFLCCLPFCSVQLVGHWLGKWRLRPLGNDSWWLWHLCHVQVRLSVGVHATFAPCLPANATLDSPAPLNARFCLAPSVVSRHALSIVYCRYGVIAPRRPVKYVKPPAPQPPPASRKRAPLVDWWIIAADSSFRTWAGAGFEFSGGPPFNRLYTSRNAGYTWSAPAEAELNAIWFSLSVAGNGKLFLAGKRNEYLYTSTDGTNWTARATSLGRLDWRATASSYDGARLAAAADGALYTSADGVSSCGAFP